MKAHIFYYRWPRIKEDLIHHEEELPGWGLLGIQTAIPARDNWIYTDRWFMKIGDKFTVLHEEMIPKEIRLHLLLLT